MRRIGSGSRASSSISSAERARPCGPAPAHTGGPRRSGRPAGPFGPSRRPRIHARERDVPARDAPARSNGVGTARIGPADRSGHLRETPGIAPRASVTWSHRRRLHVSTASRRPREGNGSFSSGLDLHHVNLGGRNRAAHPGHAAVPAHQGGVPGTSCSSSRWGTSTSSSSTMRGVRPSSLTSPSPPGARRTASRSRWRAFPHIPPKGTSRGSSGEGFPSRSATRSATRRRAAGRSNAASPAF